MCSWGEEVDASDLVSAAHHRNILSIETSDPISLVPGGISCIKVLYLSLCACICIRPLYTFMPLLRVRALTLSRACIGKEAVLD